MRCRALTGMGVGVVALIYSPVYCSLLYSLCNPPTYCLMYTLLLAPRRVCGLLRDSKDMVGSAMVHGGPVNPDGQPIN